MNRLLFAAREGVLVAFDSLRADKLRSALAVLGIAIGVSTVMFMTGLLSGVRSTLLDDVSAGNPDAFTVTRFPDFRLTVDERTLFGANPPITLRELAIIEALPSVRGTSASVYVQSDLVYAGKTVTGANIFGRGANWPSFVQGDFVDGRNFLPGDEASATTSIVLSASLARSLAGRVDLAGKQVWIKSLRFEVVGVYEETPGAFGAVVENAAWMPVTTALRRAGARPDYLFLNVSPARGISQAAAMDDVIAALRTVRRLRPGDPNTFELTRNEAAVELLDRWTEAFFLIMVLLSSLGLLVGGVGVVAIMMISVTERTPEIGMRKAVGATSRAILWPFLVESVTVTLVGGTLGMVVGAIGALLIAAFTPVPATVPLWSVLAAISVSVVSGVGFGMYPALQAARLDPIEALRYE